MAPVAAVDREPRSADDAGRDSSFARSVASAVVLHAAIFGALLLLPRQPLRPLVPASQEVAAASESEIVIEAETADEEHHDDTVASRGAVTSSHATNATEMPSAHVAPPSGEPSATNGEPPPSQTAPVAATFVSPLPAPPAAIGVTLGGPNLFVTNAAREAPDLAPAPNGVPAPADRRAPHDLKRAVEAALREPARKRERELGLGPEGPVLAALGEATSASTAPVRGRAVFLAIADGAGMIVGIDVVECDGGRDGWANAAALARAALQGKKLRMPTSASRAEMRIEITSAWKLPSGHDPGTDVSLFGVPVANGEGKQSTKIAILDPIPKLRSVEIAPDVKVAIPTISLDVIAIAGDPADIGAKPRRIVHTKLLDSKVL